MENVFSLPANPPSSASTGATLRAVPLTLPPSISRDGIEASGLCERHGEYVRSSPVSAGLPLCPLCEALSREQAAYQADRAEARRRALRARSGVAGLFAEASFAGFVPPTTGAGKVRAALENFAEGFAGRLSRGDVRGFGLTGPTGTGKTHLLCAVALRLVEQGISARYVQLPDLLGAVKATWGGRSALSEAEVMADFVKPRLLLIDEVGLMAGARGAQLSDHDLRIITQVVDKRYTANLPTAWAGNIAAEDLADWVGDRAASRLRANDSPVLFCDWGDHRIKRTAAQ